MNPDIAISVKNLTKTYRHFGHPGDRIKQFFNLGFKQYHREFTALKDVSFEIKRGETVGIIGRNGSGKSTLLQLICGILKPTSGSVEVNGRISALLELGAGFNPEFTGRENVYFQGAVMGIPREDMARRFDEISAFAEIGEFIDQPVRTYSSGMYVRLAFSTAIHVDPDILVVDEALGVGDEGFQRKCFARINRFREVGKTIIFVSHSAAAVLELCERVILLDSGENIANGQPKKLLDQYSRLIFTSPEKLASVLANIRLNGITPPTKTTVHEGNEVLALDAKLLPVSTVSYESFGATINTPAIVNSEGISVNLLSRGDQYFYKYSVLFDNDAELVRFAMMIKTKSGYELGGMLSHSRGAGIPRVKSGACLTVIFPFRCHLFPGRYFLNAGVHGLINGEDVFLHRVIDIYAFQVLPEVSLSGGGIVDFSLPGRSAEITIQAESRSP